jgi:glycosyltransferase involved in cell wall biosynthesis
VLADPEDRKRIDMRLLMIVPGGVHESGRIGVIPALLALIERLARRHDLTVAAVRQYPDFRRFSLLGAEVVNLGYPDAQLPGLDLLLQRRRLRRLLDEAPGRYDLVHALWLDRPGLLGLMAARRLEIPLVASLGGGEMADLPGIAYGGYRNPLGRLLIRKVVRSAAAVTAGSRYSLESLTRLRSDALWLPLFPDHRPFRKVSAETSAPPWRLLQAASINKVKDPSTLLETLRRIVDVHPDTRLDWVGEDTLDGFAQRKVEEMGLEGKVVFHGFKPYDALPAFFHGAHLYIQSSLHESQGVAVCEAAASGLPVAGTEVGLVKELAPDRAAAVPPGDAPALARAVLDLVEDEERRNMMARRARAWAEVHHAGWTAKAFEDLYARCVSSG